MYSAALPLTVVMPVYNEINSFEEVLNRIEEANLQCELIIVDDGSTDGTREKLQQMEGMKTYRLMLHERNAGKGAALSTGFAHATGVYVIPQDADLEYFPSDIAHMLSYALELQKKLGHRRFAVYGSRFINRPERVWLPTFIANKLITYFTNLLYRAHLTDVMTCYKLIPTEFLRSQLPLESRAFEVEAELTARLLRAGYQIYEMPIRYAPRTYKDGKKIKPRHFFSVISTLLAFRWRKMPIKTSV